MTPASPSTDSVLTPAGRRTVAAQRRGWLQAEGLDHWMLDESAEVPGRFVASSPASQCLETATELLSIRALHIAPVPYMCDGIGAHAVSAFCKLIALVWLNPL